MYITDFYKKYLQKKSYFLTVPYSKWFSAQTLIICYGNFPKKQNSDSLDIMTCDNQVFKMGKNMKIQVLFTSLDVFVNLFVTHIKLYKFWKLPQLMQNKVISKCPIGFQKGFQNGKILKTAKFRDLESFWKVLWEFRTGLSLSRKASQVMILFSIQISPFLLEN